MWGISAISIFTSSDCFLYSFRSLLHEFTNHIWILLEGPRSVSRTHTRLNTNTNLATQYPTASSTSYTDYAQ